MDVRQSKEYRSFQEKNGWKIELVRRKNGGRIAMAIKRLPIPFILLGVMKCQRFEGYPDEAEVKRIKRKWGVIYSIWEPSDTEGVFFCKKRKMKETEVGYLPSATRVVKLDNNEQMLWRNVSKDVRRSVRMANDWGLSFRKITDREEERAYWNEWRKWKRGYLPSWRVFENLLKSFKEKIWVVVVEREARLLAGMVVLICEKRAYYYFAWTSKQGRLMGAQYKLVWEGMLAAKKAGMREWDFEGIEDKRVSHRSWRGFSNFKRKFGGEEVRFPLSFREWF